VALIGDSYITGFLTPPLQPELAKLIPAASSYPNYAGAGCSLATGGICTGLFGNVPQQITTALSQRPGLKLVIMDGGGNDVLIPDTVRFPGAANSACVTTGSSTRTACQQIVQTAIDMARTLMVQNANAGVKDVIYFFYPHLPPDVLGTLAGPNPNEILDYAVVRARDVCAEAVTLTSGNLRCHFVDMVPRFEGQQAQLIAADHVHPTLAGQGVIADAIRDTMVDQCLGQPASSGCCEP
jgi:lysophospholipase L1-like esterase